MSGTAYHDWLTDSSFQAESRVSAMRDNMRDEVRKERLAARESLAAEEVADLSTRLVGQLLRAFQKPPGKRIGFCWPVRNESDIRPAISTWLEMGAAAALPVTLAAGQPLVFRAWQPGDALAPDRFGIPTPLPNAPEITPDALLIPLNAFDAAGYRLGYGGGFFDRTLAILSARSARPLVIGLGFELGRVADICPLPHDQPVDWLVTEAGVWRIRENSAGNNAEK